jgi:hypothetical protein
VMSTCTAFWLEQHLAPHGAVLRHLAPSCTVYGATRHCTMPYMARRIPLITAIAAIA